MNRLFAGTPFDRPPRCDRCQALLADCQCPPPPRQYVPAEQQTARLAVEKRQRGKVVTVVRGLAAADNDLPALLSRLETECGAGGAIKDDTLEIQGPHLARIAAALTALGFRLKA